MSKHNSADNLIESLTGELAPVRPLAHPLLRIAPWMVVAFVYIVVIIFFIGIRPDLNNKMADPFFLFETILMLSISLSAAIAASWMCVPDMREQKWLISVPITLTLVFSVWIALRSLTGGVSMPPIQWDHCFMDALLMGAVPGAAIMFLTLRGATTRPGLMAAMNILAVGALGYVGLRFTCMLDTVGHSCFYHLIPFVVLGGLLGVLAKRVFSW